MKLLNGDCLIELAKLPDKSIDFVFLDLPYGQTACKWDRKVDLSKLWVELKRVAKNERTPFFFSCTTRFGYELIKSNEKWFRWDLVWKKNRGTGFLNAYKLPMRKHEMIYCFAKKSPEYDVSSHKEYKENKVGKGSQCELYNISRGEITKAYKEPLPTSDVTPPVEEHELVYCFAKKKPDYHVEQHLTGETYIGNSSHDIHLRDTHSGKGLFAKDHVKQVLNAPLPNSDITPPEDEHELVYCFSKKSPEYDVSSHKEDNKEKDKEKVYTLKEGKTIVYEHYGRTPENPLLRTDTCHETRLPTSDITQPGSWCEFVTDEKTGHRTAKPVALMEFLLKYWTKPGQTVLDPTMGSGSMGIACKNMGREFIGIELDADIYALAQKRINGEI